jgi:CBS domain-containing protein
MRTRVSAVIEHKGAAVATIAPTASVGEAAELLARRGIGALVVSSDGVHVEGLLSERDIVRHLAEARADAFEGRVSEAMTVDIATCRWSDTTDQLAALMTERRLRHIPVVEDGRLVAIVSIGDIVKSRLDDLTLETDQLQAYVAGSY